MITSVMRKKFEEEARLEARYNKTLEEHALDTGAWIMIKGNLQAGFPPPLSIHWSHPWPMRRETAINQMRRGDCEGAMVFLGIGGRDPNAMTARKVMFNNDQVRLFDHEFIFVSAESMAMYTMGVNDEEPSHVLREGGLAEKNLIIEILEGEKRMQYDAALLDGCTDPQAFRVAMGLDVLDAVEFPPIGWYECGQQFIEYFGLNNPGRIIGEW